MINQTVPQLFLVNVNHAYQNFVTLQINSVVREIIMLTLTIILHFKGRNYTFILQQKLEKLGNSVASGKN